MTFPSAVPTPRTITENRVATHAVGGSKAARLKKFFAELPDDADVDVEITDKGKFIVAKWSRRRAIKPVQKAVNVIDDNQPEK